MPGAPLTNTRLVNPAHHAMRRTFGKRRMADIVTWLP
jgi:hypothetical protein